jgi:hypothetical protein
MLWEELPELFGEVCDWPWLILHVVVGGTIRDLAQLSGFCLGTHRG